MEVRLALVLGVPINGTQPRLRHFGFKSDGRRLIRRAGVPVPGGYEDVRSTDDVIEAVEALRAAHHARAGIVIKHDDSGAGDGNAVIDLGPMAVAPDPRGWLREQIEALPDWYRDDLARGGIVEERIAGDRFTSPSAQVDIRPDGRVIVLATHEQVLGGESGQVYLGCRFPADPVYARCWRSTPPPSGRSSRVQARSGGSRSTSWPRPTTAQGSGASTPSRSTSGRAARRTRMPRCATSRPAATTPAPVAGSPRTADRAATARQTTSSSPAWLGLSPAAVIGVVADSGLQFDPETGTGVVLHMLSGLAIDGRFGLTAIGETPEDATRMHEATRAAVAGLI